MDNQRHEQHKNKSFSGFLGLPGSAKTLHFRVNRCNSTMGHRHVGNMKHSNFDDTEKYSVRPECGSSSRCYRIMKDPSVNVC